MAEPKPNVLVSFNKRGRPRVRQDGGTQLAGVLDVEFKQDTKEIDNGDGTWRHEPVGPRYCLIKVHHAWVKVEETV